MRQRGIEHVLICGVHLNMCVLGRPFGIRQLVAQGIYISSNPHSSFFYVLTGAHGLHLLGGILGLDFLLLRSRRRRNEEHAGARRLAIADAVALYWHFMDGLWIYLFLLLFLWR